MAQKKFDGIKVYDAKGDMSQRWYVYYQNDTDGKFVKVYGGINRLKTATERYFLIAQIKDGIAAEMGNPSTDSRDIATAFNTVINEVCHSLARKSKSTYESRVRIWLKWCLINKLTRLSHINTESLNKFILYLRMVRNLGDNTISLYMELLSSLYKQVAPKSINPFTIAIKKKNQIAALHFGDILRAKLRGYIAPKHPQLWFFIELIVHCGIRPGEIRRLTVGDVDLKLQKILVHSTIAKNSKSQYVSIPDCFLQRFFDLGFEHADAAHYIFSGIGFFGDKMIGENQMNKLHLRILKHLKIDTERYKLYSWKHEGARAKAQAGIPVKQIQLQLRHSSLEQTDAYLRNMGFEDLEELQKRSPKI